MADSPQAVLKLGRIAPDELDQVRSLLAACALPTDDVDAQRLLDFVGASRETVLVGTVAVQPLDSVGLLRSLAVAPSARGLGIGTRLCREAESLARAAGLETLYLLTTDAAEFFAAQGFERCAQDQLPACVRQTEQFRRLCPQSAHAMRKRVPAAPGTAGDAGVAIP